jgi:hypothetical protein
MNFQLYWLKRLKTALPKYNYIRKLFLLLFKKRVTTSRIKLM